MESAAAISIRNLAKTYNDAGRGPLKVALDGISFDVPLGKVFGLLGPNGAGKSTLINILGGLVHKTAGDVMIWGFDLEKERRNAKRAIGIVPQELVVDPFFTPYQALEFHAGLYGVPKAQRRTEALLRELHLLDKRDTGGRSLSGGMKRRLMIAKAMAHCPPVLVLDEPSAGVDVELRRLLWELIEELRANGVTILLTTHYLEEAERLCDSVAIIQNGKLIANKPTQELVSIAKERVIIITLDRAVDLESVNLPFESCRMEGELSLRISYNREMFTAGDVMAAVRDCGLVIADVTTRDPDLEEVFLALTTNVQSAVA